MVRAGIVLISILFCICIPAAAAPAYTIRYSIDPAPDGSALWNVEYRALLPTQEDVGAFERDITDAAAIPADEVRLVMEQSASNAATVTGRAMEIRNFSTATSVQTTPTGTYGVIRYSFIWTGFAQAGSDLSIGDAFIGGLYLSKETTLTVHLPKGYKVTAATPPPDLSRDDLTWYGLRSFVPGEPQIVLAPPAFPLLETATTILIISATGIVIAVFVIRRRKSLRPAHAEPVPAQQQQDPDLATIEERIVLLLQQNDGEVYQSEIIARLGAPKSTVSSALAVLHENGHIVKVRKGRENLIRLVRNENPAGKK
ncbi:MAG: transcriptional regulator [Methanoregula sp.]|nr:MAG: transcriptional regulator [Methanoregula sp.]